MPYMQSSQVTLGFEVEFDTTRINDKTFLTIQITDGKGEISYVSPDEYLKKYDKSRDDLKCMYDVLVLECHELDRRGRRIPGPSFIDAVFDSAVKIERIKHYLTEFRMEPVIAGAPMGKRKIEDYVRVIGHYVHFIKASVNGSITTSDWSKEIGLFNQANPSWLSKKYSFSADTLEPTPPYTAEVVFQTPSPATFNPVLAIHVNVAVPLHELYSTRLLHAFPLQTDYPEKVAEGLEWPSCKISPMHIRFAVDFIKKN